MRLWLNTQDFNTCLPVGRFAAVKEVSPFGYGRSLSKYSSKMVNNKIDKLVVTLPGIVILLPVEL